MKRASKSQAWAIFVFLKFDVRNCDLTYDAAHEIISLGNSDRNAAIEKLMNLPGAIDKRNGKENKVQVKKNFRNIYNEAHKAGMNAGNAHVPAPMVVAQHQNVLDDSSPVTKAWHVPSGVCGFAGVVIPDGRSAFGKWAKENKLADKHYPSGLLIWCREFGQSMEKKEAYSAAFAGVLYQHEIKCHVWSRID